MRETIDFRAIVFAFFVTCRAVFVPCVWCFFHFSGLVLLEMPSVFIGDVLNGFGYHAVSLWTPLMTFEVNNVVCLLGVAVVSSALSATQVTFS